MQALAAGDWVIKRVNGIAYFVAPQVQAFRVKTGMVFQKGYTLGTRSGSRVLIARGNESIAVGPNTTFALSKYRSPGSTTTLLQRKGTLEIDVQKRSRPHFTVETPFFAAVVKGTRFKVTVQSAKGTVSVQRGVVGVADFGSGDTVDLGAGQSASSAPSRKPGLTVGGRITPTVRSGKKRAPVFETPPVKNVPASAAGRSSAARDLSKGAGTAGNGNSAANASSNGNGTSGGNGNGNSGGNGNGNSGGNGNGNSGGNGNGNSGGNGNGNSGGNGNGNSGGNGNE